MRSIEHPLSGSFRPLHLAAKIFTGMAAVASRMAKDDATCKHVAHVAQPDYQHTAQWLRSRVDAHLRTLAS